MPPIPGGYCPDAGSPCGGANVKHSISGGLQSQSAPRVQGSQWGPLEIGDVSGQHGDWSGLLAGTSWQQDCKTSCPIKNSLHKRLGVPPSRHTGLGYPRALWESSDWSQSSVRPTLQPALAGGGGWGVRPGQESGHNTGKSDSHRWWGGWWRGWGGTEEGRMERLRIEAARCCGKGKVCQGAGTAAAESPGGGSTGQIQGKAGPPSPPLVPTAQVEAAEGPGQAGAAMVGPDGG